MKLYKNCSQRHNIAAECHTLRLGTLFGYRSIENPDIRDEEEGIHHFDINVSTPVKLNGENTNIIFPFIRIAGAKPSPYGGEYSAKAKHLNLLTIGNDGVTFTAESLEITRSTVNAFVFCMSIADSRPEQISTSYDSYWEFDQSKIPQFVKGMVKEIFRAIHKDPSIIQGINADTLPKLIVISSHSEIKYLPRRISCTHMSDAMVNELLETIGSITFIKSPEFSAEAEYRFVFYVTDGHNFYPPASDNITISSEFAKDLIDT
ncbi:hypothetical protein [Pseudomonas fulva]